MDCFVAKPSDAPHNEKALVVMEQPSKHTSIDITCDNSMTLSNAELDFLNNRVVVDHLSASWTLVSMLVSFSTVV